ncbi:MAG: hypothetical protein Q7R95_06170 [bacterium]|nr:hypothetical protein [bacterium]
MALITQKPKVELELTFTINENEAKGLDALVGYGFDSFNTVFKEKLGSYYLEKSGAEEGLRNFFKTVRQFVPTYLEKLDEARKVFNE